MRCFHYMLEYVCWIDITLVIEITTDVLDNAGADATVAAVQKAKDMLG